MKMMRVIQWLDEVKTETEAWECLNAMLAQDGAICGEVIPPAPSKPSWRARAFMINDFPESHIKATGGFCHLPDGMRLVQVREDVASCLGMRLPPARD